MKSATIIPDKHLLVIRFTYDPDLVSKVKTLSGRRWEPNSKTWTAPITRSSVKELQDLGFELSPGITQWLKDQEPRPATEIKAAHFSRLFSYQQEGVQFIESRRGRALIGDEMGLGKSAQALVWLDAHTELRPAIIICPASLKLNWAEREARMWMGSNPRIAILKGKNGKALPEADIYIINYDILSDWVEELRRLSPKVVVADEVHYTKNSKAQRTKALKMLCKGVPHILALSGTPIVNRPAEMFNALNLIAPATFPSFTKFAFRYCNARHNGFGWDFSGASHTEELHKLLAETCMIRRLKADVLKDLPDKLYSAIPMEIDNRKEYDAAASDFKSWLAEHGDRAKIEAATRAEALVRVEVLKQLSAKGKLIQAIEWIEDFLEQGQKLVVFAVHKAVIGALMERCKNVAVKVDGSVSGEDRQNAVDRFQTDDSVRLFVGNVKAAGVGLTLTAASSVAFLEFPWAPGDVQQAEDRCHRIGQKDAVNVYYLIAQGTIDETICGLIDKKRKVLDRVLEGKSGEESSIFTDLLEQIKKG
jgi:SNF2 family DNA or RNA helicase